MTLDARQLIRLGRRWWWLIILIVLIAGGVGYGSSARRQPVYAATTTLVVRPVLSTGALDYQALQSSESLVETYRQLIGTWPVLDPVIADLQLPYGWGVLQTKTTVTAQPPTQLLTITVSDPDPESAARLSDAIAASFVSYIEETTAQLSGPTRAALDEQFTTTQEQMNEVSQQISELESSSNVNDPAIQAQLAPLSATLTQLQQTYYQLQVTKQQIDLAAAAAQTLVGIATPAIVPSVPYAPRILPSTLIALIVGLVVAIAVVALLEYRDNTVKRDTDFAALASGPLLSTIARVPKLAGHQDQLIVRHQPTSHAAEAIRLLRTKIEFVAAAEGASALTISSPGPGEGKSTITANLGVALAEAGLSTVIIDADLRRPCQHHIFGVPNGWGLTSLLTHPELTWRAAMIEVLPPNLALIPSGPLPPNPAALVRLPRFRHLLDEIRASSDIILIDSSALLAVSDPLTTATNTDGVVLVCRSGRTRRDALRQAAATLEQHGVRTFGVVLNGQRGRYGQPHDVGHSYYGRQFDAVGVATIDRPAEPLSPSRGVEVRPSPGAPTQYAEG